MCLLQVPKRVYCTFDNDGIYVAKNIARENKKGHFKNGFQRLLSVDPTRAFFKYTYRALFHAYWFKDLMPEFVLAAVVVVEDVVVEELGLGVVVGRDHLAAAAEAAGHRGRGLKKIIIRV